MYNAIIILFTILLHENLKLEFSYANISIYTYMIRILNRFYNPTSRLLYKSLSPNKRRIIPYQENELTGS